MQDVFQERKFEMQAPQRPNWYHGGDGDQSGGVLMEVSRSLCLPLIERTQTRHQVLRAGGLQVKPPQPCRGPSVSTQALSLSSSSYFVRGGRMRNNFIDV